MITRGDTETKRPPLLDLILGLLPKTPSKMVSEPTADGHGFVQSVSTPSWDKQMCKTNRSGKSICLTQTQIETLVSNLPVKYGLLAELLYYSAGRVKEITTVRVRNLNFKEGMITLEKSSTKTKETRQVPIHPRVMEDLNHWIKTKELAEDDFVFFTDSKNTKFRRGEKPVSTQSVDQFFRKAFDWNGITGASTHSFRRSRLTHLLQKGWNLREIMDISGHKNLVSLQQYLDSDKKETFEKYRKMFDDE